MKAIATARIVRTALSKCLRGMGSPHAPFALQGLKIPLLSLPKRLISHLIGRGGFLMPCLGEGMRLEATRRLALLPPNFGRAFLRSCQARALPSRGPLDGRSLPVNVEAVGSQTHGKASRARRGDQAAIAGAWPVSINDVFIEFPVSRQRR
jgi:hypothetical protein